MLPRCSQHMCMASCPLSHQMRHGITLSPSWQAAGEASMEAKPPFPASQPSLSCPLLIPCCHFCHHRSVPWTMASLSL